MLTIIPETDGLVAYEVDGRIDAADMDRIIAHVEEVLSSRDGSLDMLAIVHEIGFVTPQAVLKDVRYCLSRLPAMSRLRRIAVVSDKRFVRQLVTAEDLVVPKIEIKSFGLDDEDIARLWLKSGHSCATF